MPQLKLGIGIVDVQIDCLPVSSLSFEELSLLLKAVTQLDPYRLILGDKPKM